MIRRFKVSLDKPIDGKREATVTIEPVPGRAEWVFAVRPKGRRARYTLSLGTVAEMVAWRVAKMEYAAIAKQVASERRTRRRR